MKRVLLLITAGFLFAAPVQAAYIDLPLSQFASYNNGLPYGNHTMGDTHIGFYNQASYIFLFTVNFSQLASLPTGSKISGASLVTGTPLWYSNPETHSYGNACMYLTSSSLDVSSATWLNPPISAGPLGCWHILFTQPSMLSGITPEWVTYASSHNSTFYGGMSSTGIQLNPETTFLRVEYSDTGKTPVLAGDTNGDGTVDEKDFAVLLSNFGKTVTGGPSQGDFNGDTKVDGLDYVIWLKNTV